MNIEFALERLAERGESSSPECVLVRVGFMLERPTERSESDILLTRARRAVFDALEFTLERPTDRVERVALDNLEPGLKPPSERIDGPTERDKLDALDLTRAGCCLEFVLDRLAERAELGLVSPLEGRDPESRCVGPDDPNPAGHENCVGYHP